MKIKTQSVILAGGAGTRLWPMSRSSHPKQFLPFIGGASLLDLTLSRVMTATPHEFQHQPLVICNQDSRFFVAEHLRQAGVEDAPILIEPCGRNTAPALTIAALHITNKNDDAVMFVTPCDHLIEDLPSFNKSAEYAIELASLGHVVTLGISPTGPETGFGYIKLGAKTPHLRGYLLDTFVEKPDLPTAQQYFDSKQYLWNAGVFVLKASVWLDNIKTYEPSIYNSCVASYSQSREDGNFRWIDEGAFSRCPSNSIDYAVMEKTADAVVVPLDAGWTDVGSWSALWDRGDKDSNGNVVVGDSIMHETTNCLVQSSERLVTTVGVDNLVIVDTKDALLVASKDKVQDVKKIVAQLKEKDRSEAKNHREVYRPWGKYDSIDKGTRYQVKRITVRCGEKLSLQMHQHRAEHWIVVSGTAKVKKGGRTFLLTENKSTYIPIGVVHSLENLGKLPLEIIEVQSGTYLGEDDIVRFEDVYNRQ